ncbi:MAG: InlB B-repeat-containing protein [Christensenellaceae bacterium]|nr:InlB B-repeat-containing protein [Christensenellaceae bacterium]
MKNVLKRLFAITLAICIVLPVFPQLDAAALAATSGTVTGLADENIGLSFTGDADNAWSANGTSIIGAATSTGGTCSDTSYKSTLTITNKKSTTATLSFVYSIEQNGGKIQVDGTEVSSGASFTKELAANESVKVYIQSGSTSAATKITLTNVVLVSDVNATATFVPAENGTYTVDGKLITEEYSNTQSSMTAYQVVATPAEGYRFMGWYDVSNEKYISTSAKAALNIENDCTITARFVSKDLALFETGGQVFDDLNEAVAYAQANKQSKITLATDGSISGNYTIPTGITLLIPFDAAGTLYTNAPAAIRTNPASKPFRTLTMNKGTSITVNGAISLGGRYFAAGGGQQGRAVGDYGYIKMANGSSITVKNGGNLYAWGFISGSGSILAESGATVYEFYQIADFRGGSASSGMGNKVFPFSQYFVQNIEVPLTLNAGANEKVYSGVYAMSTTYTTAINFIGNDGMFKVVSGSFTKDYDEKTDRLIFTVNGAAELNPLALKLASMDVNSASYVLPITNNITINIQSGNVTINQDAALLAGVEVNIAEGAGLTVANGKNIYFYDSDEWNSDNFVWGPCKFKSVAYAPGKAYNRSNNDLVDAKMDVNGSVTAIGAIYTTKGGADICSSNGTGKYIQQGTPGKATATYQYNANGNKEVTIPITAAKLHNADGTYTETATANTGDIINYVNGVWGGEAPVELTVTFEANGSAEYPVEGTMTPQTVNAKTDTALNANSFTREGHDFNGWNTVADGSGTAYVDKATVSLTEDTTLYAQWEIQKFTVTWVNEDGTELEKDENVEYGTTPKYNGQEPTKEGDAQYTYKFKGWAPEIAAVTGDVTYTAVFEQTVNEYTVTWKNYDGSVLETDENVKYGTMPEYNGATPTKEGDAQYTYTFTGWTPEIAAVTGNAEYTAQFTKTVNKYTVTWKNWDGKVLKTEQVEYGATPEYNGDTPTKPTTEQYTYTFSGWDPDPKVSEVTGDATYTAQFTGTVNVYTITWKNWDGTVLETDQVEYGTKPTYDGETPTKPATEQYTYTFKGWDPEITAVTGNVEYKAVFEETVNEYTVTWKNGDTVLQSGKVKYGETPEYNGDTPTKKGDAQYTYTFTGWTPEIAAVTGNAEYTALFTETVNVYTVTWKNGDTVLKTDQVKYGETPKYNGEKPIREQTVDKTYTFIGWSPDVKEVNGNATYTAKFSETARKYKITWVIDGKKETEEVAYGVKPTHAEPTKDTDEHYSYEFSGWQPAITDVSGDATYTATFTSTPVEYTITFDTDGGTPVAPIKQGYGKEITAPAAPTKTGYTFAGWLPKLPEKMPAENMTIKAQWTVNKYTITFNTDGGTEIASKTQNYGTDIAAPADPTKTGYTFVKWDRAIPATMPAEDVTITAQWKINQYTITFFDTDGVTEIASITQDYGTAITAPADPTKTGYTFAGWDRAIPATMPAENVTITAKWTVNQYTITLMVDGTEQITIHDDYGADISQYIGAINKEGYDFIGWAKEDGTLFTQTTMPAENLVLHACWGINQYTITFDTDGGTEIAPIIADYGTPIAAPADPTKIGYTFAGWDKDIPVTMPAENVTITAKWTINQYTIAFDTDGGSYIAPITQDYNTAVTAPENPSKTGYTFAGWDMAIPATMPAENVTIKAQWTINQYTITFDTDGGSTIESITQDYGTDIIAPAAPTKEGYVFDGWDKNIPATMPAENLYIKAKWKAKTYNITWIVDGQGTTTTAEYNKLPSYGENNPTKAATAEYKYEFIGWDPELKPATEDATYTAKFREEPIIYTITWNVDGTGTDDSFAYGAEITAPAAPTKEGYTFTGWMIAEGEMLPETMPAKNIVATAQWAKNKYKLTFEAEGYGGEPDDVEWGTTIHAPASVSKEGHTLEGWYYTDGEEEKKFDFEADKMPMHDLTLTAKWTINQYTITFDTDGGNTIDSITLDYGTAITAPEAPTKDGYTFKEWSPALPETMPAGDMTVKAIYDYTYTGWITDEKGKTYLENGKKKYYQTWATIVEQEYYFNVEGYVVTGWQELAKDDRSTLFVFDNNGVFQSNMNGVNTNDAGDIYWVENGGVVKNAGLVRVEVPGGGVYYYFDPDNGGMAFKGSDDKPQCKVVYNNGLGLPAGNNYKFGNDGIIEHFEGYPNGIYQSGGDYYYCVDGVIIANGLMKIRDYYYYAKTSTGAFVCGQSYWITKTNGLLTEGIYSFDAQGRIVFPEEVEVKNGIVAENGGLYYYVDGKLTGAGLIQIGGNYYYVKTSNGEVVHSRDYWITTNNGLLPVDKYTFDEDGKLINPPVVNPNPGPEPEVKNGIVEEMGSLYYYVDGKLTGAGLIQIEGNYYYVKTSNCEVVHGRKYWITVTNDLLPAGQYKFAQDGKMVR